MQIWQFKIDPIFVAFSGIDFLAWIRIDWFFRQIEVYNSNCSMILYVVGKNGGKVDPFLSKSHSFLQSPFVQQDSNCSKNKI